MNTKYNTNMDKKKEEKEKQEKVQKDIQNMKKGSKISAQSS